MCKVFTNSEWERLSLEGNVLTYGYYHKYHLRDGTVNPAFRADKISGLILDLKEKKESALQFFFSVLRDEFCHGISVCVVPSHVASATNSSGIAELARRLAADDRRDCVDFLLRARSVDKLATGGERRLDVQFHSIIVNSHYNLSNDIVLLVDDVTTSGNSLYACRDILLSNGAKRVAMFALGRSID